MPAIITDTFDYDDIVRVLDLDEAFVHHQIDALQPKYWRIVIKTKPKGLKIFAPVMVSGNRGIDYMIYMLSRDWQITKKQRLLDYMYFGVYRQTDGFHLVGFMYLDSNPLAKPEKAFFTPHFFDRYRERTDLPMDMPKMEVMKDWIMKNLHLNSDAQGNEKYPDGIFCAYHTNCQRLILQKSGNPSRSSTNISLVVEFRLLLGNMLLYLLMALMHKREK